jgi:hypothetical protein
MTPSFVATRDRTDLVVPAELMRRIGAAPA